MICRVFQKVSGAKKHHLNYNPKIGPFVENLESPAPGSYSCSGPGMDTGGEAVIPALKPPQTLPSTDGVASSIYGGEVGYVSEPYTADDRPTSGCSGFENTVDLHTCWSPFLLN